MRDQRSGMPSQRDRQRGRVAARQADLRWLREAVRERREALVIAAVLRGHRDVEGVAWRTGLEAGQVRKVMRDLVGRHRGETLEGAVRSEVAARLRT